MKVILALLALTATLSTSTALANCARPVTYGVQELEQSVVVCPENWSDRRCSETETMLRQNVETGDVVKLPTRCNEEGCYVDACAPAGTFRYGFAKPYACAPSSCGTDFYTELQVKGSPECQAPDDMTPVAYAGELPWSSARSICGYGGDSKDPLEPGSKCTVTPAGASHLPLYVLGGNALLALVGLGFMRLRRA